MKLSEKVGYPFIFILVTIGVYLSRTNLPYYEGVYVREDGFIEWLTVFALLSGAALCIYRGKILVHFRPKLFIFCLYLLAALFLFGAGEEISWGQRIFGIKSPEYFLSNNSQGETNIHNLIIGGKKVNKLIFGTLLGVLIGFYFLIMPFLYKKVDRVKNLINTFAIPVPRAVHIVAYLSLALACELIDGGKKGEILEFGGCWIFFLMTAEPLNRVMFSRKTLDR